MQLGHIGIPVQDLQRSKRFYDAVCESLGLALVDESETSVRYGDGDCARFYIHTRSTPASNVHLCFEVDSREQVDTFYHSALAHGGADHGAPGVRLDYSPTYYAAFVLDPDGNNIEAVCRD